MDSFIWSDFHSTFLALWSSISTILVPLFVGENVILPNESSAKRLAACINHSSVEQHNFYIQKCSVFVPSFRTPFSYPCSLAGCTPYSRHMRRSVPLTVNRLLLPLRSNPHLLLRAHALRKKFIHRDYKTVSYSIYFKRFMY